MKTNKFFFCDILYKISARKHTLTFGYRHRLHLLLSIIKRKKEKDCLSYLAPSQQSSQGGEGRGRHIKQEKERERSFLLIIIILDVCFSLFFPDKCFFLFFICQSSILMMMT